jgi:hypothetical protein
MIHLKGCRSRYELSQQMSAHAFPRTGSDVFWDNSGTVASIT